MSSQNVQQHSRLYQNAPSGAVILTKHKKEQILGPVFKRLANLHLSHTDKFDTDSLGSFDHKITRRLSAKETALKKAYLACELTDSKTGIGSEGSFNSEFCLGVVDQEILAYVDLENNIEVLALVSKPIATGIKRIENIDALRAVLKAHPGQSWYICKGEKAQSAASEQVLSGQSKKESELIEAATSESFPFFLHPDFRAMNCPERQGLIALAGEQLIKRLSSLCPSCQAPDFIFDKLLRGLPCELCEQATTRVKSKIAQCKSCGFTDEATVEEQYASAFYCNFCNP
uniref:DUF6671 family protein n=1 Tax=Ningiella ruwaisensis TaxID=2364274 RepID=UPI0010A014D8|nr:DUF6671 family protein [Ningiella ruwaisensis]